MIALTIGGLCASGEPREKDPAPDLNWTHGPALAKIGDQAEIRLGKGFMLLDRTGTAKLMELTQNPSDANELATLAPEDLDWFAVFSFNRVGHVKDDEKDSLDADAMLRSIRAGTEKGNEERRRKGWSTLTVAGWLTPPHYDEATHNLEWALSAKTDSDGSLVANHNVRYLGRRGIMSVNLVADSDQLPVTVAEFRKAMLNFWYTPENHYSAWTKGDKVAEYGLTALIVGGTTAVATKTGVMKGLWKLIVAAIVGLGALLKKLFRRTTQAD